MQYGRRPEDIAFSAGNRGLYHALRDASKAATDSMPSGAPDPNDFWSFIDKSSPAPGAANDGRAPESDLRPPTHADPTAQRQNEPQMGQKSDNPRENFEKWLGGVLFPQRTARMERERAAMASGGGGGGAPHKPTVGHMGGSQFDARRRADAEKKEQEKAAAENVKMSTAPYSGGGGGSGWGGAPYGVDSEQEEVVQARRGGGLLGALGEKARRDMQVCVTKQQASVTGRSFCACAHY
jgi:hypothetical protein